MQPVVAVCAFRHNAVYVEMVEYGFQSKSWNNSKSICRDWRKEIKHLTIKLNLLLPKKNYLKLEVNLQLFATVRPTNEQIGRTISGSVQLSSHSLAYGKTEQQMFWLSSGKVKKKKQIKM